MQHCRARQRCLVTHTLGMLCHFAGNDAEPTGVDVSPLLEEFMATAGRNDFASTAGSIDCVIEVGDVRLPLLIGTRPSRYAKRFDASLRDPVRAVKRVR